MTTYALVDPMNSVNRVAGDVDPGVRTRPGWRWLEVVSTPPTFDPVTQVREGPTYIVQASQVVEQYVVRDKTAQEIDAEKEQQLPEAVGVVFRVLLNHENRIRALESRPQITPTQFRDALKALI